MTRLDFSTLSDAQINAAVAEACGWRAELWPGGGWSCYSPAGIREGFAGTKEAALELHSLQFATSCDECVRLLDGRWGATNRPNHFTVRYYAKDKTYEAIESTFPRAACLAWGRAKGIFV
jgi:hypothetical protein